VLTVACGFEDSLLRWTVAAASAATLLYTPVLKRMTAMKNLTVAFIIAASPFCGALATGLVCTCMTIEDTAPRGIIDQQTIEYSSMLYRASQRCLALWALAALVFAGRASEK
jgi:4-hydroxybenzoate polyprenyltransferase